MTNWWRDDPGAELLLRRRLGAEYDRFAKDLAAAGERCAVEVAPLSAEADRHRPELHRYDRYGNRVDVMEYHPSYHEIRRHARELGIVASAYGKDRAPRLVTFALGYLFGQAEPGYFCPVCLTDGTAFVLEQHAPKELVDRFVPRLAAASLAGSLEGAMFLTEKNGGSDVGAGTETQAKPGPNGMWRLHGEKWFCSNVDADLIFTLARPEHAPTGTRGLGLYLVPRELPGGDRNAYRIERIKEKLGVTSMATGEVVLDGALAWEVKPPGEGFRAMADMLNLSRLYNAVASVAVARQAVRLAADEGKRRVAFGKPLREHPLWRRRLVDLAVDVEAAVGLVFEAAHMMEAAREDAAQAKALRALTPVIKAVTARLSVRAASEACEALGGNGYVEDFPTPRLLRDAQVLPIWEGTTNVLALDVLRAAGDGSATALLDHLSARAGDGPSADEAHRILGDVRARLKELEKMTSEAREASAWELTQAIYEAGALAILSGDATWGRDHGDDRKARVAARILSTPDADTLESYRLLVEAEPTEDTT